IESALADFNGVREAVVLVQEHSPGDKRLVAYVVPDEASSLSMSELRSYLKDRLPPYMVPSAYVTLASFPRTPNGKINRRALLTIEADPLEPVEAFVGPRTPLEEEVAAIWAEVLRVGRV